MCFFRLPIILVVAVAVSISAFAAFAGDDVLLVLKSDEYADTEQTIAALEAVGGHAKHVLPPRAIIARVPVEAENSVRAINNVEELYRGLAPIVGNEPQDIRFGIHAWNLIVSPRTLESAEELPPLVGDAFRLPPSGDAVPAAELPTPGYNDTSSFMLGRVAVGIILPESNATGGPTDEDWTYPNGNDDRIVETVSQIVRGLNWWVDKGGEKANLTFYYDLKLQIPTSYEPIKMTNEALWMSNVMANMGYASGNSLARVRAYINHIRSTLKTDWCYSVFVVDSYRDADGKFPDGYFAYAYLGGPCVAMTYDNGSYGINRMNIVTSHETGHVFQAADEYCSPGYACCDFGYYGYLNVYNANCENGNPASVPCMMKSNSDALCPSTIGQIGWRDSNSNDVPDTADNDVDIVIHEHDTSTSWAYYAFSGTATVVPCYSPTMNNVSINRIMGVWFRIDDGEWLPASPTDGSFDSCSEGFTFVTPMMSQGHRFIDVRAISGYGNTAVPNGSYSSIQSTNIVVVNPDLTPPIMGPVVDEGDTASDSTRLLAGWSASEPDGHIIEYQYAIGNCPAGKPSGDDEWVLIRDWTSTGTVRGVLVENLNLEVGETYYFYVKAKNASHVWSDVAISDGITIIELTVGEAKFLDVNRWLMLKDKIVTIDSFTTRYKQFYIEDVDANGHGFSGIRVQGIPTDVRAGWIVTLKGTIGRASDWDGWERSITASSLRLTSRDNPLPIPMGITTKTAGGEALNDLTPGTIGGIGAHNTGMYVCLAGVVRNKEATYFYVDDGWKRETDLPGVYGVRVHGITSAEEGDHVVITGILTTYVPTFWPQAYPMIRAIEIARSEE